MSTPVRPDLDDPARRPRSFGQRMQLLLILLVLPVAAVLLPTLVVTKYFGQRPKPKKVPETTALAAALEHSAQSLLPTPSPLTPEPIRVKVRPERLTARTAKVASQAEVLGGTATEGLADTGEKHLYVDLPAGRGSLFRQAVLENTSPAAPASAPAAGAARDQLEVIIHGDEDE